MTSLNGIQLPSKIGTDFSTQYSVPDTGLTNNTTLSNNPLYNMLQVLFQGKQTDNIGQKLGDVGAISTNGLKNTPVGSDEIGKKLSTFA